jgi:nitrogenase molybdenum-iron protein NifN
MALNSKKACAVNPLKMSQPLGAAYAFMGLEGVHAGDARLAGLHLVRAGAAGAHFKEAIPLQTTAMNEATTIMGGYDNLEKALLNIRQRNASGHHRASAPPA